MVGEEIIIYGIAVILVLFKAIAGMFGHNRKHGGGGHGH